MKIGAIITDDIVDSTKMVADLLGITRQMVDKALRAGKEELMNLYINRFEELIKKRCLEYTPGTNPPNFL
jgi:hypothetical protein